MGCTQIANTEITSMIGRTLTNIAMATLIGATWLAAASVASAQTESVRDEDRDLQHEQMTGSEVGSTAPAPEDTRAVELSHEEMQSTDHEGHIEAPPTGRTQAEQQEDR